MTTEYRKEINRLYQVEYGAKPELVLRFVGIVFGAAVLYWHTGWDVSWLWPIGFCLAQFLYYLFLASRDEESSIWDVRIACLLFLFVLISFLWMPAMMAAQSDATLVFVGSTLMATVLVFLVRRGDTIGYLVAGELLVVCCMYVVVFVYRPDPVTSVSHWVGLVVNFVLTGYLAQALILSRQATLASIAAAEQAVQREKMAAIGELAGGVAHDFNNLLTAILGNLELSHELEDGAEKNAVLKEAHDAAKRAEAEVKQLLIYARKAPFFRVETDLSESAAEMADLVRRLVPEHVEFEMKSDGSEMPVYVDKPHLLTALFGLVSNAVDAMPEGGQLKVVTQLQTSDGRMVMADGEDIEPGAYGVISVHDTGTGIAKQDLPRVVQPFHSTKPPGQGTGLGLPMVLGFARDHGGAIRLLSETSGTVAEIWLPLKTKS